MAISNMQQPQQIQGGLGSLQDPRQRYFLGKLVKKAKRAVKKVVKSPIGKMAILGGLGMYAGGLGPFSGMRGAGFLKGTGGSLLGKLKSGEGFLGGLGNMFRYDPSLGTGSKFSMGKLAFGGLGAAALAAPFLMGGDDENEEDIDRQDYAAQVQRARNFYSGQGGGGAGLNFMPDKKYVMSNFYAADGGRAGYADGTLVDEDDEEEFNRSNAGRSRRLKPAFLNMGGSAGQAQAEQMLMMEYVKYKNKGGDLSFEQFVKAVMQQAAPEGAGMEQPQPVMMAAGGPVPDSTVPGYTTPAGYNKFDYRSGGVPVRVGAQEGGIMMASAPDAMDEKNQVMENIAIQEFGKPLNQLSEDEIIQIEMMIDEMVKRKDQPRKMAQEGGMIDMGGMEKDFRNEGGFVAMGGKERADDVPARLSKNEFVFTADAVRNAGGGDIDTGAEVMENLMNNLEQGGEISEESQGLQGAQEMYDQQQMLQSRMI